MAEPTVHVQLMPLHPALGAAVPYPKQMSAGAAGFDVAAALEAPIILARGARTLVPCGFAMAMPPGYEAQLRPRSGLALRHGITCLNSPGTIDADYRGEVHILLANFGEADFTIEPGMRVGQMVFAAVPHVTLQVTTQLAPTARGSGGFGSTGHAERESPSFGQ